MLKRAAKAGAGLLDHGRMAMRAWKESPIFVRMCLVVTEISLALLATISGMHYQAFAENSECMLSLPLLHLEPHLTDTLTLRDLEAEVKDQGLRTYIFVLDCSASVAEDFQGAPGWYDGAIAHLKRKQYVFQDVSPPTAHAVSKVALYTLMDALVESVQDRQPDHPTDQFAVWDVCGGSFKKVPRAGDSGVVDRAEIDLAIQQIEATLEAPPGAASRTSFLELLQGLDTTYRIYEKNIDDTEGVPRSFIITIISDFEDDPDGQGTREEAFAGGDTDRQRFFAEREAELDRATRNLSSDNIAFNLVAVASPGDRETNIVGFVRRHLRWYRYNKIDIMSDIISGDARLLYPVTVAARRLRFWYSNPLEVEGEVRLRVDTGQDLDVSLPPREDGEDVFELTIGSVVEGHEARVEARLRSGEQVPMRRLSPGESVLLRYRGPVSRGTEMVRLFDHASYEAYLVPVQFVHRLPRKVALHMTTVLSVMGFFLLALLAFGALGKVMYGSRARERRESQEVGSTFGSTRDDS